MSAHTIDEAAVLVKRTRRSLYRAMNEGRLAFTVDRDDRRSIDTAELLRVFGAFDVPPRSGSIVTSDPMEVIAALATEVTMLRSEISRLCRLLTPDNLKAFDLVTPQ